MDDVSGVIKSGAVADITDMVKKFLGPALEEYGAIFADKVRVHRVKNLIATTEKTKRILEDAGLEANQIPSRLLLPILDTCSVEDNDDLQERWAGLLASASQGGDSVSPSFVETLKQLTPKEAKHCDHMLVELTKLYKRSPTKEDAIPYQAFTKVWEAPAGMSDTCERLGLIRRDYNVEMGTNSFRYMADDKETIETTLGEVERAFDDLEAELQHRYVFTAYALRFFKACRGPKKASKA